MKRTFILFLFFLYSLLLKAGTVDTVSIFSNSMHKSIKCVVIKPDTYKTGAKRFPVMYFLHGYQGNYSNCIKRVPQLKMYADLYQVMIVCPDGGFSSWYLDSPVDTAYRYETHITVEVIKYIDDHFRTIANKEHRAISGVSMGGHGALFLALRHKDVFGVATAISGGMDLNACRDKFDIAMRIGDTLTHAEDWYNLTVINLIEKYSDTPVRIMFDCGINDIFIDPNRRLHERMLRLKIPHDYIERPGQHNWDYWRNSIEYHFLFFRKYLDAK